MLPRIYKTDNNWIIQVDEKWWFIDINEAEIEFSSYWLETQKIGKKKVEALIIDDVVVCFGVNIKPKKRFELERKYCGGKLARA